MRRTFWFAVGAASGVYTLVKAKRTVQVFTPDGLAARLAALRAGGKVFADEVRAGMSERETELRLQLGAAAPQQLTGLREPQALPEPHAPPEPTALPEPQTRREPSTERAPGSLDGHR